MKPLDSDKNLAFVNDPRRVSAQKEVDDLVRHIEADVKAGGSVQYLLSVLPPLLNRLEAAYTSLITVEAKIRLELEGQL